jgi:hypothetical protein
MVTMPPTREDRVKAFFYQKVLKDKDLAGVGYIRKCIMDYDGEKYGNLCLGIANSPSLVDVLMEIAEEAANSLGDSHRHRGFWRRRGKTKNAYDSYDRKAFGHITRCCKGDGELVLDYYRIFKCLRKGYMHVYIDFREEDIPEIF